MQRPLDDRPKPTWLTAKRLRAHGTILALCLWSVYLWNLSTPGLRDHAGNLKGTDFLHFYNLGSLARMHDGADLYDMGAQANIADARVPAAAGLKYLPLYPPQVSIFFLPFAHLSYEWALVLWWILNFFIYGLCCFLVWRTCPNLRSFGGTVFLLAAALPGFFHLIAWGQTSGLALLCFTGLYFCLRSDWGFAAGLMSGCLIFKPQLGLAIAVVFLCCGLWKSLSGALASATVELAVGFAYYGWEPLRQWMQVLVNTRALLPLLEPKPCQTHCLRTFWTMMVPSPPAAFGLYFVSACGVLYLTISCWKRGNFLPLSMRYSVLLLATVLVAPHLTVYDLVILAPAFLLIADWIVGQQSPRNSVVGTLLYLVYVLPVVGPLARWTHVQLSVIAMGGLLYVVWRVSRSTGVGSGVPEPTVTAQTTRA